MCRGPSTFQPLRDKTPEPGLPGGPSVALHVLILSQIPLLSCQPATYPNMAQIATSGQNSHSEVVWTNGLIIC
jgi:hypothetical protein